MIRLPKSILSFGAVVLVACALTLAVPRAAHAVASALVQVTNTVTTQDTSKQASQLVSLRCIATSLSIYSCNQVTSAGVSGTTYTVPITASLVINAVDFTHQMFPVPSLLVSLETSQGQLRTWAVPGAQSLSQVTSTEFLYPAGIVLAPGVTPQIDVNGGSNQFQVVVNFSGYLTNN